MKAELTEKGELLINGGVVINKDCEEVGYSLISREQQIDDLYRWIGEATGSDRTNDLYAMKEDLRYLESLEDEYIFSSISTNKFIARSDNEEEFNKICKELLELNKGE